MTKDKLIKEIQDGVEDAYTIFCKGYLNHFDMDSEVFNLLLPKLLKEAESMQEISNLLINSPEKVSNSQALDLNTKADNFYKLIDSPKLSTCPTSLNARESSRDKLTPRLVAKLNAKSDEGYTFLQDNKSFFIIQDDGSIVFSSPFIPARAILKEFGINVYHPQYALFYFGLFPKHELEQYRIAYCFSKHFNLD